MSREGFFCEKTRAPLKTVPLLDGLPSSSAERHNERRFQDTASPRTPKQWHIKIQAEEKSCRCAKEADLSNFDECMGMPYSTGWKSCFGVVFVYRRDPCYCRWIDTMTFG